MALWQVGDGFWLAVEGEHYQILQRRLRECLAGTPVMVATVVNGSRTTYLTPRETYGKGIYQESIAVLAQLSLNKHPDLPDVPLVMDFAKGEDQQQIFKLIFARQVMGRPYLVPPGVPADRTAALRKAFMDTMRDPEFLAEAEKSQLEITPVAGPEVEKLVNDLYQTPKALADKAAEFIRH